MTIINWRVLNIKKLADQYKNATVTNLACGGASSRNFINTSSYETLKKSLGKGDYLFIQFGHCDMTSGRDTVTGLDQSKLDKNGKNAMIKLGKEYHIPVIDMTAATIKLCKDSSAATSAKYYAYADTAKKTRDTMHLSSTGATKVASLIAQDTKKLGLTLSKNLR